MSVSVSEMAEFIADELHLVKQGANGFPELLAKSAAAYVKKAQLDEMARNPDAAASTPIPIYRPKGVDMPKNKKKNKKAKKAKLATLRKAIGNLAVSDEGESRRKALVKSMNAATKAGDLQTARALSYQLAREDAIRVRKQASAVLASAGFSSGDPLRRQGDSSSERQPREILQGSSRAIGNSQRPRGREVGPTQRGSLRDAYSGNYEPERPDPDDTMLASQRRIIDLETQLRKARSPGEKEALGFQLTREKLRLGHARGEI